MDSGMGKAIAGALKLAAVIIAIVFLGIGVLIGWAFL